MACRARLLRSRRCSAISRRRPQALATSPDSAAARGQVLNTAQALTQQLNGMTADIQGLRSDAELGLSDAVSRANDAMQQIAADQPAARTCSNDAGTAGLLDQRDRYIDHLSQLMDIKVVPGENNQVTVFTGFRHPARRA